MTVSPPRTFCPTLTVMAALVGRLDMSVRRDPRWNTWFYRMQITSPEGRLHKISGVPTKEGLPKSATHRIFHECVKRGLLTMSYDCHFRIQPAMTIDEATVDESVGILDEVFGLADKSGFRVDADGLVRMVSARQAAVAAKGPRR
jgi:hypothetical protein